MSDRLVETWTVRKPAVESAGGLVASHHHLASDIGARVLAAGGNAVDAAVATGFAITTVEPWMSGIGGGGFMLIYDARARAVHGLDFNNIAPAALDPADYPLTGGISGDLFGWPAVLEERSFKGYHAMAVPGYVAGMALALDRFGTRPWAETLRPAVELAEAGMSADWHATLMIATAAKGLSEFPESARIYLPDSFPAVGDLAGAPPRIELGNLDRTLRRLAAAGPRDFYEGEIARAIVADTGAGGSKLSLDDLAAYRASVGPAPSAPYREATVYAAPGLSAGPTLHRLLALLASHRIAGPEPDGASYAAYAHCLREAYAERLASVGHAGSDVHPSCTTHLSVVDGEGNLVTLTQTLLSLFGCRVTLPETGILMNNSINSFDPRPGGPNSIAPGKHPLSNMCPAIVERSDGFRFATGASGGRRILPAVAQLISFLVDCGMDMDTAFHHPRLDVSGTEVVTVDPRLPTAALDALRAKFEVMVAPSAVYPALYARPNAVGHDRATGRNVAAAQIMSPWAKVSAAG